MLRFVRQLFALLKLDRGTNANSRPEVFRRLQSACVREQVRHESRSGEIRVRP
jgi:hypothetical protein